MKYQFLVFTIILCYSLLGAQSSSDANSFEEISQKAFDFANSDVDSCFYYARYLRDQAIESSDEYWENKSQFYLGICYSVDGQSRASKEALQSFLNYSAAANNVSDMAHTQFQIAQTINQNDGLPGALDLLNQAIEGFKEINDQQMVAKSLVAKCIIQRRQRQYDVATASADDALATFESIKDSTGIADVYNALGLIKAYQGDMKGAADYFKKQTVINEQINDFYGLGHSLGNLGFAFLRMNDIENGEKYIQEAVEIRRQLAMPYELGMSLIQLAEVYVLKEDYPTALIHSQESLSIAKANDNKLVKEQAYRQLSYIEEQLGRTRQALQYYKKYESVKDSLLNDKISENAQKVEAVYQNAVKEKEIQRLEFEDKLNQTRISQQRFALGGSIFGLGVLGVLLFRLFGQKKKIQEQNGVISKALSEKDTLLREIHHRVKNNLQVISSLLRIQSNQTTDEVAIEALKEGQSRVQSMSLLHQDLYQHDNLKGIIMSEYLERLTKGLFDTYNISEDRIQLSTDIEDIVLDIDTVVPLGLIINELVTNALKYAFPNDREGRVVVALFEDAQRLILTIEDDGIGMDPTAVENGFGNGLIEAFANKLDADMQVESEHGTKITITISDYQKILV